LSTPAVTRADFQALADVRLAEAKALLDLGLWDGAYYLAGYAVELALKACIIKMPMATDAFPEKNFSGDCYTHSLKRLVGLAGLTAARDAAAAADAELSAKWGAVVVWSEHKRYHRMTEAEARTMYDAVAEASHGVLPWIKTQW
jgi:hypothetical protein